MSATSNTDSPAAAVNLYRSRLRAVLPDWPELGWLDHFLNHPCPPTDATKTKVYILDFDGNPRAFSTTTIDDSQALKGALSTRQIGVNGARLVLVHYSSAWSVDRDIVDVVATHFDLDPCALTDHFFHHRIFDETGRPTGEQDADRISSERRYSRVKNRWSYENQHLPNARDNNSVSDTIVFGFQMSGVCMKIVQNRDADTNTGVTTTMIFLRENSAEFEGTCRFLQPSQRQSLWKLQDNREIPQSVKDLFIENLKVCWEEDRFELYQCLRIAIEPFIYRAVTSSNVFLRSYRTGARGTQIVDSDQLFEQYRDLQFFKGQLEHLNRYYYRKSTLFGPYVRSVCSTLEDVCTEMDRYRNWVEGHARRQDDDYLHYLVDSQREETRSSLNASTQIGRITRLAYVFLPLQLTTSILGMNLKAFGSGTLTIGTFTTILVLLGTTALSPIILPVLLPLQIFKRVLSIWPYSHKVSVIFMIFSLTHSKACSNMLWNGTGVDFDIEVFQGKQPRSRVVDGEGWVTGRKDLESAIRNTDWSPVGQFWIEQLKEIYRIIDKPMWGAASERDRSGNRSNV